MSWNAKRDGWIGSDLDGTLAHYTTWKRQGTRIGRPIPAMVRRVKRLLAEGWEVRIFTARAGDPGQVPAIVAWCERYLGRALAVTNVKDFWMTELWDDRAFRIQRNTGRRVR